MPIRLAEDGDRATLTPMKTLDDMIAFLSDRDGVVRASIVTENGFSRRAIDSAVARGIVTRPRRGWLALREADRVLVAAARLGVILTCRTQASRLRLWLHDHSGKPHFAIPPNAVGKRSVVAKYHWGTPPLPRQPGILVDPIENVLAHIADCEPFEQALATWESALNRSLITIEGLRAFPWRPAARRVLERATPFADAGLETYLRERLRWLKVPIRVQIWIAGHRVDTLIGDRLVVQIDGAHHVGAQRSEDISHDAKLMVMGYHVIRVSYTQIMFDWATVQDVIMRVVAQGLHRAR